MIIVIGSTKDGTSKSIMATNLAAALVNESGNVCLVGGEKHIRTIPRWAEKRAETDLPKITFIEQLGNLHELLLELDKKYSYVIVAPAGEDSREFRTAVAVAHVAIISTPPSQVDVDNMVDLRPMLATAQQLNPSLRVYVLLIRSSTAAKSRDVSNARAVLADYDEFMVLNTVTYERNIYHEAQGSGRGVMEVHRSPCKFRDKQVATEEIESILQEIMNSRKHQPSETSAAIEELSSRAGAPKTEQQPEQISDPEAPRNRRTQFPFNDYEHDLIYRAAKASDRSMLSFMRRAVIHEARKILGE